MISKLKKVILNNWIIILLLFTAQCDDKINLTEVQVFEDGRLTFTANTQVAWPESLLTIAMQCQPLYDGKGRAFLQLVSGDTVVVKSPVGDTLGSIGFAHQAEFPVSFFKNPRFELQWKVMLKKDENGYVFEGYVYLDSIRIGSEFYHIESGPAKILLPGDSRFHNWASSEGFLYLSPPSGS